MRGRREKPSLAAREAVAILPMSLGRTERPAGAFSAPATVIPFPTPETAPCEPPCDV